VPEPTNRRGFLRALARSAGEAIVEATEAVKGELDEPDAAAREPDSAPEQEPEAAPLVQAPPVTRSLSVDEVLVLAVEEGLAHRADAIRDLARAGTRLVPAADDPVADDAPADDAPADDAAADDAPARSWIGRPADTAHADGTIAAVADVDLADAALADGPLAGSGRMILQVIVPRRAPIGPCSAARVHLEPGAGTGLYAAQPVELSTELMLPRVWAAPVAALMFNETEQVAYIRLRQRVADLQGVPVEDGDAEGVARHHLLGYPTETTGSMPLECELTSRGLDRDMLPHQVPPEVVVASARWRLLLQLTQDEHGGVLLGAGVERLYLWIAQDALERRDFSEVWAIGR
jgi:hypothetical protein